MARNFVAASSHWLHWGDLWNDENLDWSLSVWCKPEIDTTGYIFAKWIGNAGWFLRASATVPTTLVVAVNGAADASQSIEITGVLANDTWVHLGVRFDDTGADDACDITVFKNGVEVGASGGFDRVDANAANFGIGNRSLLDRDWDGKIAEPAFWLNDLLTDGQMLALGTRYAPTQIGARPDFYAPLLGGSVVDLLGLVAGTDNGTTDAEHPFIMPARRHFSMWSRAVAAAPPAVMPPATIAESAAVAMSLPGAGVSLMVSDGKR